MTKNLTVVRIDCDNDRIKIGTEVGPMSILHNFCETSVTNTEKYIKLFQELFQLMSKGDEHVSLYVRLEVQDEGQIRTIEEW